MQRSTVIYIYQFTLYHLIIMPSLSKYDVIYVRDIQTLGLKLYKWYKYVCEFHIVKLFIRKVPDNEVRKVKDGKDIESFPSMSVTADKDSTKIMTDNRDTDIVEWMANTFDGDGAESYYMKSTWLYTGLRKFVTDLHKLNQASEYQFDEIYYMPFPFFRPFEIQGFHLVSASKLTSACILYIKCRLGTKLVLNFFQRLFYDYSLIDGIPQRLLTTEVGNPKYVNGSAGQADYLIDGDTIDEDDVIFYKTSHDMLDDASSEEYEEFQDSVDIFVDLRKSPISVKKALKLTHYYFCSPIQSVSDSRVMRRSATVFIEYSYLFDNCDIEYNISPTFSNDKRRVRMESGLITALCDDYDIRNVDYQTRPYYINTLEHMKNSHDLLYIWSKDWVTDDDMFEFIDEMIVVGNVFDMSSFNGSSTNVVSIFTTDITADGRNTLQYNINLVNICTELARKYPAYEFILKPKFEQQTGILLEQTHVFPDNMQVQQGIYDTEELITESDIVIAIGFTSPGIDALSREKNTIIYSELELSNSLLHQLDVVCWTKTGVINRFDRFSNGKNMDYSIYDNIDPYRDGEARSRIANDLIKRSKYSNQVK